MPFISKDFIRHNLLPSVDIVKLIQQFTNLRRSGSNYQCCCPFHSEKTPSFIVNPSRQTYKCFGCGEFGNAITFLEKYKNATFVEAVEELAKFTGLEIEYEQGQAPISRDDKLKVYYEVMDRVASFFVKELKNNQQAYDYFSKARSLSDETIAKARLGYAPNNFDYVFNKIARNDEDRKCLVELGLQLERNDRFDNFNSFAFFRDRAIFPIFDVRGRVIAFGGRLLSGDGPKYLNTSESPIFKKRKELFGLYESLQATKNRPDCLVLVEGYMDVIALRNHGFTNAVAALGTASSADQFSMMFRYSDKVICCYDGDVAGQKAAWHALQVVTPVLPDNKEIRFAFIPPGHDPDTLVREYGLSAFEKVLSDSYSYSEFLILHESSIFDVADPNQRVLFINRLLSIIKAIESPVLQSVIIQLMASYLDIDMNSLSKMLSDSKIKPNPNFLRENYHRRNYDYGAGKNTQSSWQYNPQQKRHGRAEGSYSSDYVKSRQAATLPVATPLLLSNAKISSVQNGMNESKVSSNIGEQSSKASFEHKSQNSTTQRSITKHQGSREQRAFRYTNQHQVQNNQAFPQQHAVLGKSSQELYRVDNSSSLDAQARVAVGARKGVNAEAKPSVYLTQSQSEVSYQDLKQAQKLEDYKRNNAELLAFANKEGAQAKFDYLNDSDGESDFAQEHWSNNAQISSNNFDAEGNLNTHTALSNNQSNSNLEQQDLLAQAIAQNHAYDGYEFIDIEKNARLINSEESNYHPDEGLTQFELTYYPSIAGMNHDEIYNLDSPVYRLIAFTLQQPSLIATVYHRFRFDEFLAIAKEVGLHEYPCLVRVLNLVKREPTISCASMLENYRNTDFENLFVYLMQVDLFGRKANGEEYGIEDKIEVLTKICFAIWNEFLGNRINYINSTQNQSDILPENLEEISEHLRAFNSEFSQGFTIEHQHNTEQ